MKRREIAGLAGAVSILALVGTSSQAGQLLGVNIGGSKPDVAAHANVGGVNVGANVGIGGSRGPTVGARTRVGVGNENVAKANIGIGSINRGQATAKVQVGSPAVRQSLSGKVSVALGASNTARAKVDLNGDGVIDAADTALLVLDINGDGLLTALDDINTDGLLSPLDLGEIGIGALPIDVANLPEVTLPDIGGILPGAPDEQPPGFTPPPGGTDPGPGVPDPRRRSPSPETPPPDVADRPPSDEGGRIGRVLGNLNEPDIAALKIKCADVMGNPGGYDATTVAVCWTLASL
jgi:hypothetical protein